MDLPVGLLISASPAADVDLPGLSVTDNVAPSPVRAGRRCAQRFWNSCNLDLADPFVRIREALAEARKLGVANRAA